MVAQPQDNYTIRTPSTSCQDFRTNVLDKDNVDYYPGVALQGQSGATSATDDSDLSGLSAAPVSVRQGCKVAGVVGGEALENWRPEFKARHKKYADHFAIWGSAPWLLLELKVLDPVDEAAVSEAKRDYKDLLAKRSFSDDDLDFLLKVKCPGYWILGHDDGGNRYAKELYCGREWCEVCGKKDSAMHTRRFARLLPRATQMEGIGYFVIEWPIASRHKLRTQEGLGKVGKLARKTLKGLSFERGLSRWHYFGESSDRYNPHLNVLVDGCYIPDPQLEIIKGKLRRVFNEPSLIINYSYRKSPGEMTHTLKYITRATFLDAKWDIPMALELRGFRNQSWWGAGKWNNKPCWSLDDLQGESKKEVEGMDTKAIESLEKGISPKTGGEIHWGPVLPINILVGGIITIDVDGRKVKLKMPGLERRALGGGYYELEPACNKNLGG